MNDVATAPATDEAKPARTRTKKGDGPLVVTYVDAAGAEHQRASKDTVGLIVKDKAGGILPLNLDAFAAIAKPMLAIALKAKVESGVRANVKPDGTNETGENIVVKTTREIVERLLAGQLYARTGTAKEGGAKGPRGRPFDAEIWITSLVKAAEIKVKRGDLNKKTGQPFQAVTTEQVEKLRAKLLGASGAERKKMTDGFLQDKVVAAVHAQIKADRARTALEKAGESDGVDMDALLG